MSSPTSATVSSFTEERSVLQEDPIVKNAVCRISVRAERETENQKVII